jgi:hypothetical protein
VLEYLGRYTHRVAISNERVLPLDADSVRFRYKDYAHGNRRRVMRLHPAEFLRRFALHGCRTASTASDATDCSPTAASAPSSEQRVWRSAQIHRTLGPSFRANPPPPSGGALPVSTSRAAHTAGVARCASWPRSRRNRSRRHPRSLERTALTRSHPSAIVEL